MALLELMRSRRQPLDGLEVLLHERRPLRLVGSRGRRVRCIQGCAWVTAPGEPQDIYLFPGDTWQVSCDGLVLVEAVGRAAVAILP